MNRTLRVGVIGLGMGKAHIQGFRAVEGVEVAAIADVNEALLEAKGNEFGIARRYATAEEMLKNEALDIVSVATPNCFHKSQTLAALQAGCHVLCEKPMAMNAAEADEMQAAAAKAGRRIMINFSQRFTPMAWELHREAAAGALGQVYTAETKWLRRYGMPQFGGWFGQKSKSGGGPLIDLGVHRIDLALWFMGYPEPEWVLARTYDHLGQERARREKQVYDVEDYASALIVFKNGATLQASASWAGHIRERELMETRVLGTGGGLMFRNLNEGYEFDGEICTQRDGVLYNLKPVVWSQPALSPMRHFVEAIRADLPHTATGAEGATMMRVLDAIYLSAARAEPVKVA